MLSGLFGKKIDHPMADMKSVQALLDDLPKNDIFKLVMELTEWIENVSSNTDFKLDHQFAVVSLLDEAVQPHLRKLIREYFTPHELSAFQANRLWMLLSNLSRHTANAYFTIFTRYCNGEKGSGALKPVLPMLLARAVNAITRQSKYICVSYAPVSNELWANLWQLYAYAESNQYLDVPVNLYPSLAGNTTVKREMVRLVGWYGTGVNTMLPLYMHLTSRIVAHFGAEIDIQPKPGKHSLFAFDLNKPAAPTRVNINGVASPSTRYLDMASMQAALQNLIKTLDKGVVPGEINLSGSYDAEIVKQAARYLLNYFAAPPRRRSARRGIKVNLNVVNGFAEIIEHTDMGLNFDEKKSAQWLIEDISASGFCSLMPAQAIETVRVGSLLGIQPDGVQHWGVAIARRLMRNEKNQLRLGAATLANQIAGVTLRPSGGNGLAPGLPALWLYAKADDPPGEISLVMKADSYVAGRSLETTLDGKNYLLMPSDLQEKGTDYEVVKFRLIEQEAAGDEESY